MIEKKESIWDMTSAEFKRYSDLINTGDYRVIPIAKPEKIITENQFKAKDLDALPHFFLRNSNFTFLPNKPSEHSGLDKEPDGRFLFPPTLKHIPEFSKKPEYDSSLFLPKEDKKSYEIYSLVSSKAKIFSNKEYMTKYLFNTNEINLEKIIKSEPLTNKKSAIFSSYRGIGLSLEKGVSVNAENIAEFVAPIVEYIRSMRPDYIVACDRGARFIGLAVKMLYGELYGKLPTTDGTVRFRRISKSDARKETKAHLKPLVKEMTAAREKPRVLVLDDWIVSGSTKQLVESLFEELAPGRVDLRYGVLLGTNADVSGNESKTAGFAGTVDWHDDSNKIGIRYHGTTPKVVQSIAAKSYRQTMSRSIRNYAEQIRMNIQIAKQKALDDSRPKQHRFLTKLQAQTPLFDYEVA